MSIVGSIDGMATPHVEAMTAPGITSPQSLVSGQDFFLMMSDDGVLMAFSSGESLDILKVSRTSC